RTRRARARTSSTDEWRESRRPWSDPRGVRRARPASRVSSRGHLAEVIVRRVHADRVGRGARWLTAVGAEPADVHPTEIHGRMAVEDPCRDHLPHPAGAGDPVGAEPGRDEEAADLRRLAENELAIGSVRLGAVDEPD